MILYRLLLPFILLLPASAPAQISGDDVLRQAAALEEAGKFRESAGVLQSALPSSDSLRQREILFEIDRLRRIRLDYSLTREELWDQLRRAVSGITRDEFDSWITLRWFDARTIDDTLRFVGVSRSNLFWRHEELSPRRIPPKDEAEMERRTLIVADSVVQASRLAGTPYVLPKRFRLTASLTVDTDAAPAGELLRAWIPIPRSFPYQSDIRIISSSSPVRDLAAADSPIRSAMLEQAAVAGSPTVFTVDYEYTAAGVWYDLDASRVKPRAAADPGLAPYLREEPHVVFTERISQLSRTIVGTETNPVRIARAIHVWISENILYSYALEYSTIRNIGDYCLTKGYGDCGQHTLLFITLCRYNGIPARWQSGWYTFPGAKTIHDWAEVHIEPYGWVPVDPDMGIFAMRYYTSLGSDERRRLRDFYFGGLEQYRMAANAGHSLPLSPRKRHIRSDTVDFQRGEVEWNGGNLYFDKWSYALRVREIPR